MRFLLACWFLAALFAVHVRAVRNFGIYARSLNASEASRVSLSSFASGASSSRADLNATSSATTTCGDVWMSWLNSSLDNLPTWTTYLATYTYHNITAATTTACDGHPRVIGGSDALTTIATGTNTTLTSVPKNFTIPTPTCNLAPSECTGKLASWSLCSGGPTTSVSNCGACSIWGGTVQLNYFPITRNATRNLCQTGSGGSPTLCPLAPTGTPYSVAIPYGMTPCDYITDNVTSTRNSGPYIVSDGQTFYQNRVYISLDTVYASNSCGYVGKQYAGTTLTLASSDIYSVHGYHHEFEDSGYQFNFVDLSHVPANQYYANCGGGQDPICVYSGTDYRYGTDFINGRSDIDFGVGKAVGDGHTETGYQWIWQGAYSPTLLVPLQIRTLDPAWSTCSLNLVGLYDPPRVLTGELTTAMPTTPTVPKTSEAAPAASPTSEGPPATRDSSTAATLDPKPSTSRYTETSYTYDPLSISTPSWPDSTVDREEPEPTSLSQDLPDNEEHSATSAGTGAADTPVPVPPPGSSEAPLPSDPANPPPTSLSDNGPETTDGIPPTHATQTSSAEDPHQPLPASSSVDEAIPQLTSSLVDTAPSDELGNDEPDDTASTTREIGGIIASILGAQPMPSQSAPPTTTNALSVLESAAQTFGDGGQDPAVETSYPLSEPSGQVPTSQLLPQPITLSDGEHTHTLAPLSGLEGLYTLATSQLQEQASSEPAGIEEPGLLPAHPAVWTSGGSTRTIEPVPGSSGLYTVIGPTDTYAASSQPVASDLQPAPEQPGESVPMVFTGPATYVADGWTHTIKPVQSSSGVFVVDGSRTLTQLAPSRSTSGSMDSGDTDTVGSASSRESTVASASGGLPPVVTLGSGRSSSLSGANADATTASSQDNGAAAALRMTNGLALALCLLMIGVLFI